jgi:hypothetical protein
MLIIMNRRLMVFYLLLGYQVNAQEVARKFEVTFLSNSKFLEGEMVYLSYQYADHLGITTDSQYVSDGKIVFKGEVCQPSVAQLYDEHKLPKSVISLLPLGYALDLPDDNLSKPFEYFLVPGKTTIRTNDEISESTIIGPRGVSDFEALKQVSLVDDSILMDILPKMIRCFKRGDTACIKEYNAKAELESSNLRSAFFDYCKGHPESPVALYALKQSISPKLDSPEVYLALLAKLSKEVRVYPEAIALKKILENTPNSYIGKYVKNVRQLDINGDTVSLDAYKGKFVLLYFWSSSSYDQFIVHEQVLPLWNKYHTQNFTIISIGMETLQSKRKWERVVKAYQTPWIQLTDFNGLENNAVCQLGVARVPFNLLINTEGRIILRNTNPAQIDLLLAEVLK